MALFTKCAEDLPIWEMQKEAVKDMDATQKINKYHNILKEGIYTDLKDDCKPYWPVTNKTPNGMFIKGALLLLPGTKGLLESSGDVNAFVKFLKSDGNRKKLEKEVKSKSAQAILESADHDVINFTLNLAKDLNELDNKK